MTAHRSHLPGHPFLGWPVANTLDILEKLIQSYRLAPFAWMEKQGSGGPLPLTEKLETPAKYIYRVALPGVNKDQLSLHFENECIVLRIVGTRKHGRKRPHVIRRAFSLPVYTDGEAIEARLKNGILTITIPKKDRHIAPSSHTLAIN